MKQDWVSYLQEIRANNNVYWVGILRIALNNAPEETKALLKMIRENDLRISEAIGKLADDEDSQKDD